jgi:hypothetical protein
VNSSLADKLLPINRVKKEEETVNKKNKSSVPDGNDQLTSLWTSVKQDRDELRVQIHLAKKEVKDEWLLMEDKWHKVQQRIHLSSSRQAKVNHEGAPDNTGVKNLGASINDHLHESLSDLQGCYQKMRENLR